MSDVLTNGPGRMRDDDTYVVVLQDVPAAGHRTEVGYDPIESRFFGFVYDDHGRRLVEIGTMESDIVVSLVLVEDLVDAISPWVDLTAFPEIIEALDWARWELRS